MAKLRFHDAAKKGDLQEIKRLIEKGVDIRINNDYVLGMSAMNGYLDVVKYLIENGANIHAQDDYALRLSAEKGHLDIVKYLVENGGNIHALDETLVLWCTLFYQDVKLSKGLTFI